jgi:hypothetical protein
VRDRTGEGIPAKRPDRLARTSAAMSVRKRGTATTGKIMPNIPTSQQEIPYRIDEGKEASDTAETSKAHQRRPVPLIHEISQSPADPEGLMRARMRREQETSIAQTTEAHPYDRDRSPRAEESG